MKALKEVELIKKVYEEEGKPNNEVQAFALSCLIEYKKQLTLTCVSQQRELLNWLNDEKYLDYYYTDKLNVILKEFKESKI